MIEGSRRATAAFMVAVRSRSADAVAAATNGRSDPKIEANAHQIVQNYADDLDGPVQVDYSDAKTTSVRTAWAPCVEPD
jgi:hypothetical protein